MDRERLENPSRLHNNRSESVLKKIKRILSEGDINTYSDKLNVLFSRFKGTFLNLGKPSMNKRYARKLSPPSSDTINKTMEEVHDDIGIAFKETDNIGQGAVSSFNHTVTDRTKLQNIANRISEKISDYTVSAHNFISKNIIIQDSFGNKDKVNFSKTIGDHAEVSPEQGVVTLGISGAQNQALNASVDIEGDGMPSNFGIVRKTGVEEGSTSQGALQELTEGYISEDDEYMLPWLDNPRDNPNSMFDEQPNTWYEYQMINFPDKYKDNPCNWWGLHFDDGTPIYYGEKDTDSLNLVFTISLQGDPRSVNWIHLNPYFYSNPFAENNQSYMVRVNEVATSNATTHDGDFVSVLTQDQKDGVLLFSTEDVGTQIADMNFENRDEYVGQAVWSFPSREVKYIKVVISCQDPYDTKIGHIWYHKTWTEKRTPSMIGGLITFRTTQESKEKRIEGHAIPKKLVTQRMKVADTIREIGSPLGWLGEAVFGIAGAIAGAIYDVKVEKTDVDVSARVEAFPGWRWSIGIREINAMANTYHDSSSITSVNYTTPKPIDSISINTHEFIPEEFYMDNLATKNEWIKYFLSFDRGNTWHRISPLEHRPTNNQPIPPSVIQLNSGLPQDARDPNKTYVDINTEPREVMFRADFSRPEDINRATPILHKYKIRITPREGSE